MVSNLDSRVYAPVQTPTPAHQARVIGWLLLAGVGVIVVIVVAFAIQMRQQVRQEAEARAQIIRGGGGPRPFVGCACQVSAQTELPSDVTEG